MVRVSHPDFCTGAASDVALSQGGQTVDVGTIALVRGTVVEGVCTVGGRPQGQIKVFLGPPEGAGQPTDAEGRARMPFSLSAITDNEGRYRLAQRVPPGTYQVHAARQAHGGNIFDTFGDMRETMRPLSIGPGLDRSTQNFALPAR
jgi:hypothetical protein